MIPPIPPLGSEYFTPRLPSSKGILLADIVDTLQASLRIAALQEELGQVRGGLGQLAEERAGREVVPGHG